MIYSSIYANAELNLLPIEARHLYIGTLVLADDEGRLRADPRFLKGQFFAYDENISSEQVEKWLEKLTEVGQIDTYDRDGVRVLRHPNWKQYQRIRADMYVTSKLPSPLRVRNESDTEAVHNISKDNINKDKEKPHASLQYLDPVPSEDLQELTKKYDASAGSIKRKAEQMANYCRAKGKTYKNYRAFLENGLDKDFGRRPAEKKSSNEQKYVPGPEEQSRIDAIVKETKEKLKGTTRV